MTAYDFIVRKKFFNANKYQQPLIAAAVLPLLVICLFVTVFIIHFHGELIRYTVQNISPDSSEILNRWAIGVISIIWVFFILVVWWSYNVTNQIVGAFDRVLEDIDRMLAGEKDTHLKARKDDVLANELLWRINKLMDRMPYDPEIPKVSRGDEK